MSKILTISIAAYNVEKYIRETLDSLCVMDIIDDLEVFIVDDGGKDRTLEIAKEYAEKYPQTFFPIHKENGGWGSTVNYSIEHATGKYFRLLDGDDYYDKEGLKALVDVLRKNAIDVVYTPYRRFDDSTKKTVEWFKSGNRTPKERVIRIEEAVDTDFVMHSSTFKTDILKNNKIQILEHCFYTDNEYRTKATAFSQTAYIMTTPVYQYRVGREGQSVDITGLKKHYKDNLAVLKELIAFYENMPNSCNVPLVQKNINSVITYHYNTLILLNNKEDIIEFDSYIKTLDRLGFIDNDKVIARMRRNGYRFLGINSLVARLRNYIASRIKMHITKS